MFLSHAEFADFAESTRCARAAIQDVLHPSLPQADNTVCG